MSAREDLHALLDTLPDDVLPTVAQFLSGLRATTSTEDEYDDVPLSAEEEAMFAESWADYQRGDYVTSAELRAQLGLPEDS